MILKVARLGHPVLRMRAQPVAPERITGAEFQRLLDDMVETMRAAPGAGLAAQQVGLALQLCVIEVRHRLYEVANPRIVHLSGEEDAWEGCLSLPDRRALRRRAEHAVMVGQDRRGRRVTVSGHGELARAIQHEFDHLQGVLYTDGLPPGAEILTEAELAERFDRDDDGEAAPD
jgi:peptide deformylase